MRTVLSQFCEEFESTVRPVLEPLSRVAKTLSGASPTIPARALLPHLLDLRHQLEALADKVAQQQAYVLIFGPLKSGKSTLMNAMSAAYVSEVTCLPAYPCMVYVSHADRRQYEMQTYSGDKKAFTEPTALRREVMRAHAELADRIREREQEGGDFDPTIHWPQAIRRVDVKVPAKALERSGAVLVDTPGLYSRMKFGYDRMTREFRNAAASAIFVVKTDNLFLEQVFEEFNRLLELFSRIFLVVNLDTTKKDLRPDGTLATSLEGEAPERVIEAFENLSMSAPLKRAAEEGRLSIYPVDLLQAASKRISGESDGSVTEASFDAFLTDLTDYLNSTDYLVAFLGDSLRRARALTGEIGDVCKHDAVGRLTRQVQELRSERTLALTQKEILTRLETHDWSAAFHALETELGDKSRDPVTRVRTKAEGHLESLLDGWFESEESLATLTDEKLRTLFEGNQRELIASVQGALHDRVRLGSAGLVLSDRVMRDLEAGGIALDRIGRDALEALEPEGRPHGKSIGIPTDEIPVKKSFWDWILFRRQASICKRLFGPPEDPARRIPASVKAKRLGEAAQEVLRLRLGELLDRTFSGDVDHVSKEVFGSYAASVREQLSQLVETRRGLNAKRLEELDRKLAEVENVLGELKDLAAEAEGVGEAVSKLQEHYGETEPEVLIQPVKAPEKTAGEPSGAERPATPEVEVRSTKSEDGPEEA